METSGIVLEPRLLVPKEVERINGLCLKFCGAKGSKLRDRDALLSACGRTMASAGGTWAHGTVAQQGLAILDGIISSHPFVDGNKRTALVALDLYLGDVGLRWRLPDTEKFDLIVALARGERKGDRLPGEVIKIKTRPPDISDRCKEIEFYVNLNENLLIFLDEHDRSWNGRWQPSGCVRSTT